MLRYLLFQFGSEMDALKGDLYMRIFGNELMRNKLVHPYFERLK
jgi:hypothetical protein